MSTQTRHALIGVFIGVLFTALGMWLVPNQSWVAIAPLLLGFLLASPLVLVGAPDGWAEVRMVPWPVLVLNVIGWSLLALLVGGVLAKRKAV